MVPRAASQCNDSAMGPAKPPVHISRRQLSLEIRICWDAREEIKLIILAPANDALPTEGVRASVALNGVR